MTQQVKWRVIHTSSASAPMETWVPASLAHTQTNHSRPCFWQGWGPPLRLFFDRALVPVLSHEHLCMCTHLCTSTNKYTCWFLLKRALWWVGFWNTDPTALAALEGRAVWWGCSPPPQHCLPRGFLALCTLFFPALIWSVGCLLPLCRKEKQVWKEVYLSWYKQARS